MPRSVNTKITARAQAKSIWDIAAHYTAAFKANIADLNIRQPTRWSVATDHIAEMIDFAEKIVSLLIAEREGTAILGPILHEALESQGLEFGARQIYHRLLNGEPVFPCVQKLLLVQIAFAFSGSGGGGGELVVPQVPAG